MPINFPDSPTVDQSFTAGDRTWKWDGSTWQAVGVGLTATSPVVLTGADISFDSTSIQANADAIAINITNIQANTDALAGLEVVDITDLTATATEINHTDGVTSNIQTQLDAKQDELTGLTSTVAELNFTDGVTSAIQTQLDARVLETNGAVTTAATDQNVVRNITLSTADPTGGTDGDVWLKYTA
jgi:hypothetical protein